MLGYGEECSLSNAAVSLLTAWSDRRVGRRGTLSDLIAGTRQHLGKFGKVLHVLCPQETKHIFKN